jgi:DNA-binding beta-propeller fold protein YncE
MRSSNWIKYHFFMIGVLMLLSPLPQAVQAAQCEVNSVAVGDALFDTPGAMLATSDGQWLFVLDSIAMDLKVVSTAEQQVVSSLYLQGIEPSGLTISPDQTRLYVAGAFDSGMAVVDISAPDPMQWQVVDNWGHTGDFTAMLFDTTTPRLLVGDRNTDGVRIFSKEGPEVAQLTVPTGCSLPSALAVKGTYLFVACETDNNVAVFDLNSLQHLKNIRVDNAPVALLAHPTAEQVFVANVSGNSVSIINTSNLDEERQTVEDDNFFTAPGALAWVGGKLWILDQSQAQFVLFDLNQNKLEKSTCPAVGRRPTHLLPLSEKQGVLYVAHGRGVDYVSVGMLRQVKNYPQVLMAGFDPMLLDLNDKTLRVVAVVEEGQSEVELVGIRVNLKGSQAIQGMEPKGKIPLDKTNNRYGLVYEFNYTFPRIKPGPLAQQLFGLKSYNLFGGNLNQLYVLARDNATHVHSYPTWSYTSTSPTIEVPTAGMAATQDNYVAKGFRRQLPQVIMAGLSPMKMDVTDHELKVMAVVREGTSPIQSVTLNALDAASTVAVSLNQVMPLPNGDLLYEGVLLKTDGRPMEDLLKTYKKYDKIWNEAFTVIVRDQAGQTHRFPELKMGDFSAQ